MVVLLKAGWFDTSSFIDDDIFWAGKEIRLFFSLVLGRNR